MQSFDPLDDVATIAIATTITTTAALPSSPSMDRQQPSRLLTNPRLQSINGYALDLTLDERINMIYHALCAYSPYVRRSMLTAYDMLSSIESIPSSDIGAEPEHRQVVWMNASHLFMDIILFNREPGRPFHGCKIHVSDLSGMPMRGIHREYVDSVATVVWNLLRERGLRLHEEDGTPVPPLDIVNDDDKQPVVFSVGGGEIERTDDNVKLNKKKKMPARPPESDKTK